MNNELIKDFLRTVIKTLNSVSVSGEQNLDRILGVILNARALLEALEDSNGNTTSKP